MFVLYIKISAFLEWSNKSYFENIEKCSSYGLKTLKITFLGLVSYRWTSEDDISMYFDSWIFRPYWIYPWVIAQLPAAFFLKSTHMRTGY